MIGQYLCDAGEFVAWAWCTFYLMCIAYVCMRDGGVRVRGLASSEMRILRFCDRTLLPALGVALVLIMAGDFLR